MSATAPWERLESNVRFYSRQYPAVFRSADGPILIDEHNRRYIDFFCGAGALNYGHNHPLLKRAVLDYIERNGIMHSLDMQTEARVGFLERFQETILAPRSLDYKVQFTGPTGTNAVEAALKLARKVTGRSAVAAFTGAFHGVSVGALAATASRNNRNAAGVQLDQVIRLPFEGFLGSGAEITFIERILTAPDNGLSAPAAILFETVQGEGGVNAASGEFVERLFALARRIGALVIVDDIQAGCGRTGRFFSFEHFGVVPDIVCLSKSISGYGFPMSLLLFAPEHDVWKPGEHNGTFRGNNVAFVAAAKALEFWRDEAFLDAVADNVAHLEARLAMLCERFEFVRPVRKGRGMFAGIDVHDGAVADAVSREAFSRGMVIETCGAQGSVLKIMPPINIDAATLDDGLGILEESLETVLTAAACATAPGEH